MGSDTTESNRRPRPIDRRTFLATTGAAAVAGLAGCGGDGEGEPEETEEPTESETTTPTEQPASGSVTFVHDTHFHGTYGDLEEDVNIATYFGLMEDVASEADNAIKVGNGDDLASSVLSAVFDGEHIIDAFNAGGLAYDTFGNHDFDMGPDVLRERVTQSETTWLSANVVDERTGDVFAAEEGAQSYELVDVGDLTVGLTGVINMEAPEITSMGENAVVEDLAPSINDVAGTMREEGADLVVVLSHLAGTVALDLAAGLDGVDAIVGDHAADVLEEPEVVDDTILSFVGDEFEYVGELTLTVEDGERTDHGFTLHETAAAVEEGLEPHPDVLEVAESYQSQLSDELDTVIGETEVALDAREDVLRAEESNLGNYISDVVRETAGTDVALTNGGGIRTDQLYEPGDITSRMVRSWLPFGNSLVAFEIDGETLLAALENGVSAVEDGAGRFPQVSGMSYTYDPDAAVGSRIVDVTVGGEELDPGATYTLAANNYLAGGGDGYEMFTDLPRIVSPNEGQVLATLVIDAIQEDGTIAPETEGRITVS